MSKTYALGCSRLFLFEKRTELCIWHSEGSTAEENSQLRQELPQSSQLCWMTAGEVRKF